MQKGKHRKNILEENRTQKKDAKSTKSSQWFTGVLSSKRAFNLGEVKGTLSVFPN